MLRFSDMSVRELQEESDRLERSMGQAEKSLADLRVRLGQVSAEIAKRTRPAPEPRISDHALLRYIERIVGVDMDELRDTILTDQIKAALRLGATGVTVNGIKMIAKDGVIVTVLSEEARLKRKAKKPRKEAA